MKTKLIVIALVAFSMSVARGNCYNQTPTKELMNFNRYMVSIRSLAPSFGLKIERCDESAEEYFWLYCFIDQHPPTRPEEALRMAKRDWNR